MVKEKETELYRTYVCVEVGSEVLPNCYSRATIPATMIMDMNLKLASP